MNKKQFCLINLKVSHFFNETDRKSQLALFIPRRFTEFKFKIKFQILLALIAPIICLKMSHNIAQKKHFDPAFTSYNTLTDLFSDS